MTADRPMFTVASLPVRNTTVSEAGIRANRGRVVVTFHFSITPDSSTHARLVRQDVPSLVLYDGSATVWLSPGEGPQAAWEAARMAAMLARAAEAFGRECQQLAGGSAAAERRAAAVGEQEHSGARWCTEPAIEAGER